MSRRMAALFCDRNSVDSLPGSAPVQSMEMRRNVLNLMSKVRQRAFHFIEKDLARRGILDLSPAHGDILFVVFRHQPVEMGQLAELTGRDKSTLSSLVNRLVNAEYLKRKVSASDRRRAHISLTAKAERLTPVLVRTGIRVEKTMLKGFGDDEAEKLLETMRKIYDNLAES